MARSMNIKIEEAYNDCLERMLSGEPMGSCLNSYPEYADKLYSMLYATYDIKRKAYYIQPRPEFKYWARARMQNLQYYNIPSQEENKQKSPSVSLRHKLAISMAALLVFIIASSGTVAASEEAMPDEPLYPIKLAVEQARLTLATSDIEKVEIYAQLAEKRAQEIAVMTVKGNTEKAATISSILSRQLQQIEENLAKIEAEETTTISVVTASKAAPVTSSAPSAASEQALPIVTTVPQAPPASGTIEAKPDATDNATTRQEAANTKWSTISTKQSKELNKRAAAIIKAKEAVGTSTTKSLAILQDARDKAPDSLKSSLNNIINQTKNTNKRIQAANSNSSQINQDMHNDTDQDKDDGSDKPGYNPTFKSDRLKNRDNLNTDTKTSR